MRLFLGVTLVLACAGAAQAQVVQNPTTVTFQHIDYTVTDRYEGGYFALGILNNTCDLASTPGATPVQLDDLKKPAQVGTDITTALVSRPLGCYVYKVRAYGGGLVSDWSAPSGPFERKPAVPSAVVTK